ncbi:hypothetical protein ABZP36_009698 [Zizania latifolia]
MPAIFSGKKSQFISRTKLEMNGNGIMLNHGRTQKQSAGILGFIHCYVQKVKDMVAQRDIADQIQELKARIVEASNRRKRYKLDSSVNFNSNSKSLVPIDRQLPALYAELDSLVGIDGPREDIIKLVDDGEKRMKVVSIIGSGGSGKTTLANQVYQKIGEKFDCKAFVSVSQNPDMGMVFRTILYQVKKDEVDRIRSGDKEQVINELRGFLKNQRYYNGIGNMQALEFLSLMVVDYSTSISSLQELGTLTKLRTLGLDWRISDFHEEKVTYADNFSSSLGKLTSNNERWLTVRNNGFRCLQKLKFVHWMNLMFEEGAMTMLETLEFQIIAHEAQDECGFDPPDLGISNLSALRNLVVNIYCECARVEEVEALEAAIRIAARLQTVLLIISRTAALRPELVQECRRAAEEMDGIMVSAATGAMNSLLDKLTTLLGTEFRLHKGVHRDVAFLSDELSGMNALLEKLADMEALDPQMKEWRNQVRELAYDIDDCIDRYMYQLHHEPQRPCGIMGFLPYVQRVKELLARREVAQQMKLLKDDIVEASHRRKRYKIDPGVYHETTNVVPIDPRLPALYVDSSDLVGIDVPRDQLINLVNDGDQSLKVISIVGFGGLGKTTLANEVYKRISGQFNCRAFVSVSQKPDIKKILRSIISQIMEPHHASTNGMDKDIVSQIKNQDYSSTEARDEEWLINILRGFLKEKR